MTTEAESLKMTYPATCSLCGKMSDLNTVETCYPIMPNTLTDLIDHNTVLWKCDHCGGWN